MFKGVIRWFDLVSGYGMIRLVTGESIQFYACNAVGAKSHYPGLAGIEFSQGETVTFTLDSDEYIVKALGATNVCKVGA